MTADSINPTTTVAGAKRWFNPAAAGFTAYGTACLVPLIMAGLYLRATSAAGVEIGFPLDDSWIHAQYARTIVQGRPFEYVPGRRSIGTTSVLFDVVWAAASKLTGEYVYTIHTVNTLLTMGTAALLVALLLRMGPPPLTAGLGAALIVATFPFAWSNLSGMETALATFLTTAALMAHVTWGRRTGWRPLAGPVVMALAAMARPENLVLYPLSELDRLMQRWRWPRHSPPGHSGRRLTTRLAAFGLTILPYFALNYSVHGVLVPNTYQAKIGSVAVEADVRSEGWRAIGRHVQAMGETVYDAFWFVGTKDNPILLALAAVGVMVLLLPRKGCGPAGESFLPVLLFVGGTAATGLVTMGLFFPRQAQRYLIQWMPLVLIYGVAGIHLLASWMSRPAGSAARPAYALMVMVVAAADLVMLCRYYPEQVDYYVTSVKNINEMQVTLGRWVDQHTPATAVVATNDIGAIAFFGNRPVVDTMGLIDPEMVRRRHLPNHTQATLEYLQQRGVTHALLFPRWHPDLLLSPALAPVHRVVLADNVICGDERMLVATLNWDRSAPRGTAVPWLDEELRNCRYWLRIKKALPF